MQILTIILIIIILILLIYYIINPYSLFKFARKYVNRDEDKVSQPISDVAQVLKVFKTKDFIGNVYSILPDKLNGEDGSLIYLIWFHGGAFVNSDVLGIPDFFKELVNKGIILLTFDYPINLGITEINQSDVQQYIVTVINYLMKNVVKDNKVFFIGDSMGSFYALTLLNNSLNKGSEWPILDVELPNPTTLFSLSGFGPKTKLIYKILYKLYIQRLNKNDLTKNHLLNKQLQVYLFTGSKDPLQHDSIKLHEDNKSNTFIFNYHNTHDFAINKPTDPDTKDVQSQIIKVIFNK